MTFQNLTGIQFLQSEIACKHNKAMEKKTWDERIAHFNEMDLTSPDVFKKASNPIGMRSAVLGYKEAMRNEPTGYMISLDACSSSLQILSLLVSCPTSWNLCGGRNDTCESAYKVIYEAMNLSGSITQKVVKQTIMTALYGSTSMPETTFGENIDLFYSTMEEQAPGAWSLNLALQGLWDEVSDSVYSWTLPDNFHACVETKDKVLLPFTFLDQAYEIPKIINQRPDFHKGLGPNIIHSIDGMVVREMYRRCMFKTSTILRVAQALTVSSTPTGSSSEMVETLWNNYLESGFLSVRILDYLYEDTIALVDPTVIWDLIHSLPKKPFDLVSVHDCFRCHPNYGNDLRRQYNTIMADINDSTLLQFIATQVGHSKIRTNKVGVIPRQLILDGNYPLA